MLAILYCRHFTRISTTLKCYPLGPVPLDCHNSKIKILVFTLGEGRSVPLLDYGGFLSSYRNSIATERQRLHKAKSVCKAIGR